MEMRLSLFTILAFLLWVSLALGQSVSTQTVMVDDTDPGILYPLGVSDPISQWASMPGAPCTAVTCTMELGTQGGTWHAGTGPVSAIYLFRGVAVTVYFAIFERADWFTNVTFSIDGIPQGSIQRQGAEGLAWKFNFPAFSISNLIDDEHRLVITQEPNSSGVFFDYLTYEQTIRSIELEVPISTTTSATTTEYNTPLIISTLAVVTSSSPLPASSTNPATQSSPAATMGSRPSVSAGAVGPATSSVAEPEASVDLGSVQVPDTTGGKTVMAVTAAIAGILAMVIVIVLILMWLKRRRKGKRSEIDLDQGPALDYVAHLPPTAQLYPSPYIISSAPTPTPRSRSQSESSSKAPSARPRPRPSQTSLNTAFTARSPPQGSRSSASPMAQASSSPAKLPLVLQRQSSTRSSDPSVLRQEDIELFYDPSRRKTTSAPPAYLDHTQTSRSSFVPPPLPRVSRPF